MKHLECKISKLDEENRIVEGVVYRPSKEFDSEGNPTDYIYSHGDWATVDDVKKASHKFMEKLMNTTNIATAGVDKQHNEIGGYGYVVENYIAKCDIPEIDVLKDDWVAAIKVTDDTTWNDIKLGNITGFSIGGTAIYVEGGDK